MEPQLEHFDKVILWTAMKVQEMIDQGLLMDDRCSGLKISPTGISLHDQYIKEDFKPYVSEFIFALNTISRPRSDP